MKNKVRKTCDMFINLQFVDFRSMNFDIEYVHAAMNKQRNGS